MQIRIFSLFHFLVLAIAPYVAQAQVEVPQGVVTLTTEQFEWQDSPVGWELAELYGDMRSNGYSVVRLRLSRNWDANNLVMNDSAISSPSRGRGNAGNVRLLISDSLRLVNDSFIETDADQSGGGNIDIRVANQIYLDGSQIVASTRGEDLDDAGGNINIDPIFLILKNSEIVASAVSGDGGAIFLSADNFIYIEQN